MYFLEQPSVSHFDYFGFNRSVDYQKASTMNGTRLHGFDLRSAHSGRGRILFSVCKRLNLSHVAVKLQSDALNKTNSAVSFNLKFMTKAELQC